MTIEIFHAAATLVRAVRKRRRRRFDSVLGDVVGRSRRPVKLRSNRLRAVVRSAFGE
jgi:hypothetical protein